ncbi:MAG: hypothetical protein AAF478_01800 [Pseudomonadota bacterium]
MENLNLTFHPQLPLWLVYSLCVAMAVFCVFGLIRGIRGSWVRTLAAVLFGLALFNPSLLQEDRTRLPTIVPVVVDNTTSQRLDNRADQTANAVTQLKEQFEKLDGHEILEVNVTDQISRTSDISTALFSALNVALQDIPREQLGASIFVTDGQVHDIPEDTENSGLKGPLHVLITGEENEKDRRIVLKSAPRFGVVGESQEIVYTVEETGFPTRRPVEVTIRIDGEVWAIEEVTPGEEAYFVFDVPHGGKNIIELEAAVEDGEITATNNQAFSILTGIRENLRVLLVSGEPHAGERTWRNLLKSDASVDLVHFTILRPPEKQDGTPINQLSLIAFPTRELFVQKIDEFDLIIFDRYKRRGVLPILYFDNIARYVQNGGAVLIAAGPEYADTTSIGITPLNAVLPALANGEIHEKPFLPQLSETGQMHPVTRRLDGWNAEKPEWSRWFRSVGVSEGTGDTVMVDDQNQPLLILQRQNEGRVALFLSDHVWLWSRGFEGGGPHLQLLRRLAHWLMKEPELEEERLSAETEGSRLIITRQTLGGEPPAASIQSPSGETGTVNLEKVESGVWRGTLEAKEIGLHRISNGDLATLAQIGPVNPRELAAVVSNVKSLASVAKATKGSVSRLSTAGDAPRLVSVGRNATTAGNGWIGLPRTEASVLNGVFQIPLFAGLIGLSLLLLALAGTWFREGR